MAAPVEVAGSRADYGATTGTTLVLTKPSQALLQPGDVLVVAIRGQGTIAANTDFTKPTGWVRATPQNLASDRAEGIYYKPIADAAAVTAESAISNYTFGGWTSGRSVGTIWILRGVDLSSPIAGASNYLASATLGAWTPSLPYIAYGLWGDERTTPNSHVPTGTPTELTLVKNVQSTLDSSTAGSRTALWLGAKTVQVGGTAAIAAQTVTWASPSGVRTVGVAFRGKTTPEGTSSGSYDFAGSATGKTTPQGQASGGYAYAGSATGTQPSNGGQASGAYNFAGSATGKRTPKGGSAGGYAYAGSATGDAPTPTGFPSVSALLAQLGGATMIHRDIATNPKACKKATNQGVELGHGVIEFSCGWTSDLVPFMLGEQYLDTQSQVTGNVDPKTMTWAHLQANYQITLNAGGDPQSYWKLEDAIQEYPNHVFAVDPKYGNLNVNLYVDAMLDLLDLYGGPSRFIVKFDSPGATAIATLARSRGYTCMNYWGTDTTAMASQQSNWDLIGARFDDATAMAQANSYGKPSWAFPIDSQANYATAVANGADLVMVRSLTVAPVSYDSGHGTASGGYSFAGTAAGERDPRGTASGAFAYAGTAAGERDPRGSASGGYAIAGSAAGERDAEGSSSGAYSIAGAAAGRRSPKGVAAGGFQSSGVAIGSAAGGGVSFGFYGIAGVASGERDPRGAASGAFAYAGIATGDRDPEGMAAGGYAYAGVATGAGGGGAGPKWPEEVYLIAEGYASTLVAEGYTLGIISEGP